MRQQEYNQRTSVTVRSSAASPPCARARSFASGINDFFSSQYQYKPITTPAKQPYEQRSRQVSDVAPTANASPLTEVQTPHQFFSAFPRSTFHTLPQRHARSVVAKAQRPRRNSKSGSAQLGMRFHQIRSAHRRRFIMSHSRNANVQG